MKEDRYHAEGKAIDTPHLGLRQDSAQWTKLPQEIIITTGGKEYLDRMTDLQTECFRTDPAIRYMLSVLSDEQRLAYHRTYMYTLLKASAVNKGIFQEAKDWSCGAVWMLPGERVDNELTLVQSGFVSTLFKIGLVGVKRMLIDFASQSNACKKKGLKDKGFKRWHYLWFIGTHPNARKQGLARQIITAYQAKIAGDGLPIYLEATSEASKHVYQTCGFEVVQSFILGKGTHDASGAIKRDGEGVTLWAMVWMP